MKLRDIVRHIGNLFARGRAVGDAGRMRARWTITRYASDDDYHVGRAYDRTIVEMNLLLNEGIALAWDLIIAAGGTAWNNANARLGVGDDNTAAAAGQGGLQAAANKTWKAMAATYPQRAAQTVTWRAVFAGGDANYAWKEFTLTNAADDTGTNLNRKVTDQGVKANGQTWTLDLAITLS